jgi:immune inhibitor A
MKKKTENQFLQNYLKIHQAAAASNDGNRCMMSPHPDLKKKIKTEIKKLTSAAEKTGLGHKIKFEELSRPGLNDGLIYPGDSFPLGTTANIARSARLNKAPLKGKVKVIVVLVDFSDKKMTTPRKHFEDLFFSKGKVSTGSVREYYDEVTNGKVDIVGEVVGPYRLPKTKKQYANGESGTGLTQPNARTMAKDTAKLADAKVDFSKYDNDGDNYVDAFVIVHAGTGAETNNNPDDIWSHKWVMMNGSYEADNSTRVYSYLTIPEDCRLGVCAHELGHLLFGFPDLYDSDYSSEGVGDWCLMGGGSWNNKGLTPAHPSAWCKCNQGWVSVVTPKANKKKVAIKDVKTEKKVYKLWKGGSASKEYFLIENRQKKKFDKHLPGAGMLVWHVDDSMPGNDKETHYRVALMQADGNKDLENGNNRGDSGDVFPGKSRKKNFSKDTNPHSNSYANAGTSVALKNISASGATMYVDIEVK